MRSKITFLCAMALMAVITGELSAQHYVPMDPLNKNVIYEEFTGVKCPNCPSGHAMLAEILAANPGRAFAVAYHPFNSSYTLPYTGDPDFRRHYADSLYMTPYCGTSRYMPSAFVHRRVWTPGERITERSNWAAYGNTIMSEPSPLNVGMATSYNSASGILSVTVDVYYTADVTGSHNLMVTLAENNLQSQQSGATGIYTHKHTFRESFVGQWGDFLSENAQAGAFQTRVFTFDNSTTNYNMENCELMAYVIDNSSMEVVSGIGCPVGDTTYFTPDVSLSLDTLTFTTIQQCLDGLTTSIMNNSPVPVDLIDVQPISMVPNPIMWIVDPWPFTTFPHTMDPGSSVNLTVKVYIPTDHQPATFLLDSLYIISEVDTSYLMIAVDHALYTDVADQTAISRQVLLYDNYPNPVLNRTTFKFYVPSPSEVKLEVLNLNGHCIRTLYSSEMDSGHHEIPWNAVDENGKTVPAGVYLYRLTTHDQVITRRCVVMK